MLSLRRVSLLMAAIALAMVLSPNATMARGYGPLPMARSYSGSYPVIVTQTQHGNFTGCLTLTGSGSASLVIGSEKFPGGSYSVINDVFVATIQAQGYSQNAGLLFIVPATRKLGLGTYEEVYGGSAFELGALAFGAKGGC
jgi:hypothetical protein